MSKPRNDAEIADPIMARIIGLLTEKNITDQELAKYLGVGTGTVSHWKYNRRSTYLQYINEICDFLETDPNYLFRGTDKSEGMSGLDPIEEEVIMLYRKVGKERQDCVRQTLKLFASTD